MKNVLLAPFSLWHSTLTIKDLSQGNGLKILKSLRNVSSLGYNNSLAT